MEALQPKPEEHCDHKWVHLETHKETKTYNSYSCVYIKIDRFFCEKCLETKEIKREERLLEKPSWYY
jgi:hypothetical protein